MRNTLCLIAAAAALAATPAAAQENNVAPVTNETMTTDVNAVTDVNATTVPDMNAMEPVPVPAEPEVATRADADDESRGFPWGVIGLVGLIGLLGRRRG